MFWIELIGILLLAVIAFCAIACVGWLRLTVAALNTISELLLEQRRWPASSSTLKPGFKAGKHDRAN